MASGNSGSNLLFDIIYCIRKCVRGRISERDHKAQRKPLGFMYDLWIFCFWGAIGSGGASDPGMSDGDGNCCLDSGVWITGGSDRNRASVPTISFIYSGMDYFDGTDMGTVHRYLETQRIISCEQKTPFGKNRYICLASVWRHSGRMLSESLDRRKNSGLSEIITGIRQYSIDIKNFLQHFVQVVIKYPICGRISRKALILKGTEKLPFFLQWKFFFYIFSIFYLKKEQKSYGLLHSQFF